MTRTGTPVGKVFSLSSLISFGLPKLGATQIEFDAFVVGLARVDPRQHGAVSVYELLHIHGRKEVESVIRVVPVPRVQDPPLSSNADLLALHTLNEVRIVRPAGFLLEGE